MKLHQVGPGSQSQLATAPSVNGNPGTEQGLGKNVNCLETYQFPVACLSHRISGVS